MKKFPGPINYIHRKQRQRMGIIYQWTRVMNDGKTSIHRCTAGFVTDFWASKYVPDNRDNNHYDAMIDSVRQNRCSPKCGWWARAGLIETAPSAGSVTIMPLSMMLFKVSLFTAQSGSRPPRSPLRHCNLNVCCIRHKHSVQSARLPSPACKRNTAA